MIGNWFEAKIKYTKIDEDGRARKVNDLYLLDGMSYTEAESRIMKEMESVISGDYYISNLKKSNITEIVFSDDENDDRWYKARIVIIDVDEVSGKAKTSSQYYLVAGSDTTRALANLEKSLATFIVPWEVGGITDTNFMDVYPYVSDDDAEKIPENLTPGKA